MAEPLERLSRLDAADMLDPGLGDADDFDVALERFVLAAGPNRESALIGYFLRQTTREMLAYRDTDVGQSASHVQIAPLDCDNASLQSGPAGCPSLVEFGAAGHPGPTIGCNQHHTVAGLRATTIPGGVTPNVPPEIKPTYH